MSLNMLDLIIIVIIFLLGTKGILNGFIKEALNFVGLVGGIYLASRFNLGIGEFIGSNFFGMTNSAGFELVGFVAIFASFWFGILLLTPIVVGFSKDKITPKIDKYAGYGVSVVRYFIILGTIMVVINNSQLLKEKFSSYSKDSFFFPILSEVGDGLLNISNRKAQVLKESNGTIQDTNLTNEQNNTL